jgi:short-subunit dehydrogenase
MKLKDKVIVITGASDGIGKEIALRLAKEGTKLALIARNKQRLDEVCEKAKSLGAADVEVYPCDIRQTDKLNEVKESITSHFGGIVILINAAGVWQKLMPAEEIKRDTVDEVIGTNLTALIHITRMFLPTLKKREEAAIINIISKSGMVPQGEQSVYTASKYGARGFTEVLKVELKGTNVRVAGVYQSGTNTRMFEKTGDDIPTEKFTNPADLADVVSHMLSLPEKIWLHDVCVEY